MLRFIPTSVFKLCAVAVFTASTVSAEEAQVRETRSVGDPVFLETNTGMDGNGVVYHAILMANPVTVSYQRVAGAPLTASDATELHERAVVCEGWGIRDLSIDVSADVITFTYQCPFVE